MHWYAIHTKPRQERVAQDSFEREGIKILFPKLRQRKKVRRKYEWITGPLFPCYIFAFFDVATSGRFVRYARGVNKIVSFGGKLAVVEESIIKSIVDHCEGDIVTVQPSELKPGDTVEIQEGPFSGLRGIFERNLSGAERVVILLESIGAGARVQVSQSQVEKI